MGGVSQSLSSASGERHEGVGALRYRLFIFILADFEKVGIGRNDVVII